MTTFSFSSRCEAVRDTRGVSLLIVLGLLLLLLIMGVTATGMVQLFIKNSQSAVQGASAYYAAESGVELALYDTAAFEDGYETDNAAGDVTRQVCGDTAGVESRLLTVWPTVPTAFSGQCTSALPYRFVNLADNGPFGGKGFWRLFSRSFEEAGTGRQVLPNPYFGGNREGVLQSSEWGVLSKNRIFSLSLMADDAPYEADPAVRYATRVAPGNALKVVVFVDSAETALWNPSLRSPNTANAARAAKEDVLTWTLSGIAANGTEHTVQGVVWENDFRTDCDESGNAGGSLVCFVLDFTNDTAHPTVGADGDALAGEDIYRTMAGTTAVTAFNRVSGRSEAFYFARPKQFLQTVQNGMSGGAQEKFASARLSISLISSLAETSGVLSNRLRYKVLSDVTIPDEYQYIVAEGFSGRVKQTIETRFKKETTIPIFSYVIFQ